MPEEKDETMKQTAIDEGIAPEYIVKIDDKYFVIYKGLLDLAHKKGFKGKPFAGFVKCEIAKLDTSKKECVHIATARFGTSSDYVDFSATGHASLENISSTDYQGFYVTISETRAKARAFRDALNIPLTSVEELGSDIFQGASNNNNGNKSPITQKQIDLIKNILEQNDKSIKILSSVFSKLGVEKLEELSIPQADTIIKKLKKQFETRED